MHDIVKKLCRIDFRKLSEPHSFLLVIEEKGLFYKDILLTMKNFEETIVLVSNEMVGKSF